MLVVSSECLFHVYAIASALAIHIIGARCQLPRWRTACHYWPHWIVVCLGSCAVWLPVLSQLGFLRCGVVGDVGSSSGVGFATDRLGCSRQLAAWTASAAISDYEPLGFFCEFAEGWSFGSATCGGTQCTGSDRLRSAAASAKSSTAAGYDVSADWFFVNASFGNRTPFHLLPACGNIYDQCGTDDLDAFFDQQSRVIKSCLGDYIFHTVWGHRRGLDNYISKLFWRYGA